MQSASRSTTRFIRFAIWAVMMFAAFLAIEAFNPRRAFIVPTCLWCCVFPWCFFPCEQRRISTDEDGLPERGEPVDGSPRERSKPTSDSLIVKPN